MKAFPTGALFNKDGLMVGGGNGMDLRDFFAAKAMQSLILNPVDMEFEGYALADCDSLSLYAYEMADAMMKAREK